MLIYVAKKTADEFKVKILIWGDDWVGSMPTSEPSSLGKWIGRLISVIAAADSIQETYTFGKTPR